MAKAINGLSVVMLGLGLGAPAAQGASVILNEYNAVGSTRHLDGDAFGDSDKADTRLGRVQGNGGNWFELAVVGDGSNGSTVDMRGWMLDWVEDGTDMGTITLSNDTFWSSVRAGTLITIGEEATLLSEGGATVVNGSDTGIDFLTGDNWAHIHTFDTTYVTSTTTNVTGDGPGNFSVGNDDWELTIKDDLGTVIFGPAGEKITDDITDDAGVNSREVFKLEADVSTSITAASVFYSDGTSSSFGAANVWGGGDFTQDFSAFGVVPEPASLVLVGLGGVLIATRRRAHG
ncbi:MAG: PEP-CTERM sorting domain-containing protein [Planctomycetota bacterium]